MRRGDKQRRDGSFTYFACQVAAAIFRPRCYTLGSLDAVLSGGDRPKWPVDWSPDGWRGLNRRSCRVQPPKEFAKGSTSPA
jgi:hypothetical protein